MIRLGCFVLTVWHLLLIALAFSLLDWQWAIFLLLAYFVAMVLLLPKIVGWVVRRWIASKGEGLLSQAQGSLKDAAVEVVDGTWQDTLRGVHPLNGQTLEQDVETGGVLRLTVLIRPAGQEPYSGRGFQMVGEDMTDPGASLRSMLDTLRTGKPSVKPDGKKDAGDSFSAVASGAFVVESKAGDAPGHGTERPAGDDQGKMTGTRQLVLYFPVDKRPPERARLMQGFTVFEPFDVPEPPAGMFGGDPGRPDIIDVPLIE